MKMFDLYSKVRWIRQQAGDKKEELIRAGRMAEAQQLDRVEDLLDRAEGILERTDMTKED